MGLSAVLGAGVCQSGDVRDSGAIDQDIDSLLGNNLAKHAVDALPIGNVATVNTGRSSHIADGVRHRLRLSFIQVHDVDTSSVSGKHLRDRAPDAACAARHRSNSPSHSAHSLLTS